MLDEPLYIQVIRDIQEKILTGVYPSDSLIPSEGELQATYNMSRTTIRRAIAELVNAGYLLIIKGVGTKVMPSRMVTRPHELISWTQLMRSQGLTPGTQKLQIDLLKKAPLEAQRVLGTAEVVRISRVRTADNTPISFNTSYLPARLLKGQASKIFEKSQSLYEGLEKQLGIKIFLTEDTYSAIKADSVMAKTLGISKGDPLLLIERVAFDKNQQTVEYSVIHIRADRYKHTISLRVS